MRWYVLASGPSLQPEEIEAIRKEREADRCRVVVTNSTIFSAPWADACYAVDQPWWKEYHRKVPDGVKRISARPRLELYGVEQLPRRKENGISKHGVCGNSSGHHAISYAYMQGADEIIVIGFDCCHIDGETHHHGDHPEPFSNAPRPHEWIAPAKAMAAALEANNVRVVNCGSGAVEMGMERMTLDELLTEDRECLTH